MPAPFRLAVLLLTFLSPAVAAAQKPPPAKPPPASDAQDAARTRAQEGLKLFGADRWPEALEAFRDADRLFHAPSVTLYIARCQRKLGQLLEARATYDQILAEDLPKDATPQFIQAHVEAGRELEILKARIPTLQVSVTGVPVGEAQVFVNGAPIGEGKRELNPGTYRVEIRRRSGAPPIVRTIVLVEGKPEVIAIDLGAPAGGGGGGGGGGMGWILPGAVAGGVGVIGLAMGAITGGLSLAKVSDIKKSCAGNTCPASLKSDGDTARLLGNLSTAGFVIGAAGIAVGAVLVPVMKPARVGRVEWKAGVGLGRMEIEGRF